MSTLPASKEHSPPTQDEIDAAYAWADRIIARIEEGERETEQRHTPNPPEESR